MLPAHLNMCAAANAAKPQASEKRRPRTRVTQPTGTANAQPACSRQRTRTSAAAGIPDTAAAAIKQQRMSACHAYRQCSGKTGTTLTQGPSSRRSTLVPGRCVTSRARPPRSRAPCLDQQRLPGTRMTPARAGLQQQCQGMMRAVAAAHMMRVTLRARAHGVAARQHLLSVTCATC